MLDAKQPLRRPVRAALLAFGLAACSAPSAARRQPPPAAPRVLSPAPGDSRAPAEPRSPAPASVGTSDPTEHVRPLLVVSASGDAYLLVAAAPSRREDVVVWDVVYLAGESPAALEDPADREHRATGARELLGAFQILAEVAEASRLSVTAVLGRPGERGVAEQHRFARDQERWREEGPPASLEVPQVPTLDPEVIRDRDAEERAREAAVAFITDADRGDYDAAWERTSPLAKVVMSRAEFERRLAPPALERRADPVPYLAFLPPAGRFLPGAFIEAWITRESPAGASVETLTMRLDDDMEWRVAGVATLTRARPPVVRRACTGAEPAARVARGGAR